MRKITIQVGDLLFEAELNDSEAAEQIAGALPIKGSANVWGDEIYFDIPVQMPEAPDARADVEVGELAYWPPGSAFCIFYGPTPVSSSSQPRAYSPVNVVGRIRGDATLLRGVASGTAVSILIAE
ncbi:MAG: hypothetical protein HC802_03965 [Caldilineaceae bacterium]|nr:hypothetical protein [Caldilineaceae bacterium]